MTTQEKKPLYEKIADWIRNEILEGRFLPGDRLPAIRQMTNDWNCTTGTVQRAYAQLSQQGLVVSRPGQGTYVSIEAASKKNASIRRATLFLQAETFLLESLTAGFHPDEIESAIRWAFDRWRVIQQPPQPANTTKVLLFAGSHDPAISWLAEHFSEIAPGYLLQPGFSGSLAGLMALANNNADLAGCHLWDKATGTYNSPFVQRLLPGRRVALLTFAHRQLGMIVEPGNPKEINRLVDLARSDLVFVNRQPGSGTRVWLDAALQLAKIDADLIKGYSNEKSTHTAVAAMVAERQADVGLGLQSAALAFSLDFIPLVRERYDLAILAENLEKPAVQQLAKWLSDPTAHEIIQSLGGYDTSQSGTIMMVE